MATFRVDVGDLPKVLTRDMKARERRINSAIAKTARAGVAIVKPRVPVAFDDLKDSLHATKNQIIADAPHAGAVENGSRPHFPPLEPLIKWVKLRGMQALYGGAKGPTGKAHADMVGLALKGEESSTSPKYKRKGKFSDIDAPTRVARAIQMSIGRNGTKPYFYMGGAVPDIVSVLDSRVREALPDGVEWTG